MEYKCCEDERNQSGLRGFALAGTLPEYLLSKPPRPGDCVPPTIRSVDSEPIGGLRPAQRWQRPNDGIQQEPRRS